MKNMQIIDNCISMFVNQPKNGIPILPFEGEMNDTELKLLLPWLKAFKGMKDVRDYNSNYWNVNQLGDYQSAEQYFGMLLDYDTEDIHKQYNK